MYFSFQFSKRGFACGCRLADGEFSVCAAKADSIPLKAVFEFSLVCVTANETAVFAIPAFDVSLSTWAYEPVAIDACC
jgi:hypothetical protein